MRTFKNKYNSFIKVCFLLFCLSLNSVLFAENDSISTKEEKCRLEVTENEAPKTLAEKVSSDLCSQVWTEFKKGGRSVFEFNEYGTVNVVDENNEGGFKVTYFTWELMEENGNAILFLTNPMNNEVKSFEVAQDCDGIFLTGMDGGVERFLSTAPIQ